MERYEFGVFTLDVAARRLSRLGEPVALAPKTWGVLLTLLRNAGRLVPKHDLLRQVWPECFSADDIDRDDAYSGRRRRHGHTDLRSLRAMGG